MLMHFVPAEDKAFSSRIYVGLDLVVVLKINVGSKSPWQSHCNFGHTHTNAVVKMPCPTLLDPKVN